jgi:hypothetical protein
MVFIFEKVKLGFRTLLFKCPLDMGYMGHGGKNTQGLPTKIPAFHL